MEGHQLADMDRLAEGDLVYGESDDIVPGIAARASISDLIKQFQDRAPVALPAKFARSGVISTVIVSWRFGRFIGLSGSSLCWSKSEERM